MSISKPNAPCKCCSKRYVGCRKQCVKWKVYEIMHRKYRASVVAEAEQRDFNFAVREKINGVREKRLTQQKCRIASRGVK